MLRWTRDHTKTVSRMKTIDSKTARVRRNLTGVRKETPIESLPDAVAVLGADGQNTLVVEALVGKTAQSLPASRCRQVRKRDRSSRPFLIGFRGAAQRDDAAAALGYRNVLFKIQAILPIPEALIRPIAGVEA